MFCTRCGVETEEKDRFCSQCGMATGRQTPVTVVYKTALVRSRYNNKIAGVCAGVASYMVVDVTLIRLIWLTLAIIPFPVGIVAYLIGWIVIPKEPERLLPPAAYPEGAVHTGL
jgi:phage shock protein C